MQTNYTIVFATSDGRTLECEALASSECEAREIARTILATDGQAERIAGLFRSDDWSEPDAVDYILSFPLSSN